MSSLSPFPSLSLSLSFGLSLLSSPSPSFLSGHNGGEDEAGESRDDVGERNDNEEDQGEREGDGDKPIKKSKNGKTGTDTIMHARCILQYNANVELYNGCEYEIHFWRICGSIKQYLQLIITLK